MRTIKTYCKGAPFYIAFSSRNVGFRGSVQFTSSRRRPSEARLADIVDGSNFLGNSQKGKRGELSGKLGRHCIGPLPGPTGRTNDAKKTARSSDALQAILLQPLNGLNC